MKSTEMTDAAASHQKRQADHVFPTLTSKLVHLPVGRAAVEKDHMLAQRGFEHLRDSLPFRLGSLRRSGRAQTEQRYSGDDGAH